MQRSSRLFSAIAAGTLIYRAFWAFSIKTTFVPDEYYQSVEPVNIIFYGASNSGLNSTWEWRDEFRIRSFVPLIPYMLLYQINFFIGSSLSVLLHKFVVLKGPRLLNAILSSYSDFLLYAILKKITRSDYLAIFITCIHLFSWSGSYCLSRTLANSTETAFLIIGLYFWLSEASNKKQKNDPIQEAVLSSLNCSGSETADQRSNSNRKQSINEDNNDLRLRKRIPSSKIIANPESERNPVTSSSDYCVSSLAVALIAVTVHCRPTAVLFWAPLVVLRITQQTSPWRYILFHCIPTGVAVLLFCVAVDSIFYGRFTVTPFNFFYINISRNYAAIFYGAKSWHWNFSHGLPVMLGLYTPFLVLSIVATPQPEECIVLIIVSLLYVVLLRCVTAHQEYRFLLPALPFLHIAVGFTLWDLALWCLPGLGEPSRHPHTVLSYCLSSVGLRARVDSERGVERMLPAPEKVIDERRSSGGDSRGDSGAQGGGGCKQNQDHSLGVKGVGEKRRNEEESTRKSPPPIARMLCLSLLFLVVSAHLSAAFYLSTRHQRGPEAALTAIASHINTEHSQQSLKEPKVQVPPRRVVVLLLAPCHSFPGFGLLPSLIERTGWTVQLFSPDCSPSVPVPSPKICPEGICSAKTGTGTETGTGAETGIETETETALGAGMESEDRTMTESRRFESDPALFVSSMEWSGTDYIVTFNSYLDAISPLLKGEGFRPLFDLPHADVRYDYDDPHFHHTVHVLHRDRHSDTVTVTDSDRDRGRGGVK